jgi:hypothetical protein
MQQHNNNPHNNPQNNWPETAHLDRVMKPEQFSQVIEAILSGKYSWACVLILRFAGYNPLHYIPYRTYNRIMKDHVPKKTKKENAETQMMAAIEEHDGRSAGSSSSSKLALNDLNYAKPVNKEVQPVRGGMGKRFFWF